MKGCYADDTGSGTFDSCDSAFDKDSAAIQSCSCMLLARVDYGIVHETASKGTCFEAGPCSHSSSRFTS
jgi:hypothetical protein